MPPLIGYAAAAGGLTVEAWILAAILFLWQFPHFYAIAWMYKEDYARAGIRDAAGGGARLPVHGAADGAVWNCADSGEPAASGVSDVGEYLIWPAR